MLAQVPGVRVQPGRAHVLVVGLGGLQVRGQRDLGVDHDVLAAGQPDHQVGPHHSVRRGHGDLLVEIAAGAHPGQLDHPAQLQLAPATPGLRPPQRGDQRLRLRPQLLRGVPGEMDLLGQRGVRPDPGRVGLA